MANEGEGSSPNFYYDNGFEELELETAEETRPKTRKIGELLSKREFRNILPKIVETSETSPEDEWMKDETVKEYPVQPAKAEYVEPLTKGNPTKDQDKTHNSLPTVSIRTSMGSNTEKDTKPAERLNNKYTHFMEKVSNFKNNISEVEKYVVEKITKQKNRITTETPELQGQNTEVVETFEPIGTHEILDPQSKTGSPHQTNIPQLIGTLLAEREYSAATQKPISSKNLVFSFSSQTQKMVSLSSVRTGFILGLFTLFILVLISLI